MARAERGRGVCDAGGEAHGKESAAVCTLCAVGGGGRGGRSGWGRSGSAHYQFAVMYVVKRDGVGLTRTHTRIGFGHERPTDGDLRREPDHRARNV